MRDGCYVEGCRGEIVLSREIRTNVARGGQCSVCGARYRSFGRGDWKFETDRVVCTKDGCDGYAELEVIPGRKTEGACWKCDAVYTREPEG